METVVTAHDAALLFRALSELAEQDPLIDVRPGAAGRVTVSLYGEVQQEVIAARLADHGVGYLDAPVRRLGGAQVPMPYSLPLEKASIPTSENIKQLVRAVVGK